MIDIEVPKLADLPKAKYLGEEVTVLCYDPTNKAYVIRYNRTLTGIRWVDDTDLKPLQTHWDASEFHQFFMKHPMEECIAYEKRDSNGMMLCIKSICHKGLVSPAGTVWAFKDIVCISHDKSGLVECVKEVVR